MRKPAFCICQNKDADQLRSNCAADRRLCFRYIDSTIPPLPKSEISSLYPSSVFVQPGLCRIRSETRMLVFSRCSSNVLEAFQAGPVSIVGSMSRLAFRSSKVRLAGLAHSITSCQLLVKG